MKASHGNLKSLNHDKSKQALGRFFHEVLVAEALLHGEHLRNFEFDFDEVTKF